MASAIDSPYVARIGPRARQWHHSMEFVWAMITMTVVTLGFATFNPIFRHWFVLPVTIAGALALTDVVQWFRARNDLYDPAGIMGILGLHFFFFAPFLHLIWDTWLWNGYWLSILPPPRDWRPWIGLMAALNVAGLFAYRFAHVRPFKIVPRPAWRIDRTRFLIWGLVLIAVAFVTQLIIFAQFGGIGGYVATFERGIDNFRGYGFIMTVSESLPILVVMVYAMLAEKRPLLRSWGMVGALLVVYLLLRLLFGGLAGSRANIVWGIFWAAGIVHFMIRPLSRRWVIAGLPLLFVFMYAYGFYKAAGRHGLDAIFNESARSQQIENSGRSAEFTLLGDLARADVQAYILYATSHARMDFDYGMGRTYLGAVTLLVPSALWPSKPDTKVRESTNVVFGPHMFERTRFRSTKVHGLAGEAVLNFGMWSVPVVFFLMGLVIYYYRKFAAELAPGDTRLMLLPFFSTFCILLVSMDSDVLVFFAFKQGLLPMILVFIGSQRPKERA